MRPILVGILFLFCTSLTASPSMEPSKVVDTITKMYLSSMAYIFKKQSLINGHEKDKSILFGQKFMSNVAKIYEKKFKTSFPNNDIYFLKVLKRVMIEVMEDNRTLIYDYDLDFKGFIPAIFAFQISDKFSSRGLGVKVKFTSRPKDIRNKMNAPDTWERKVIDNYIGKKYKSYKNYYDENSKYLDKAAYRLFTPVIMKPFCLNCHGVMEDNPLNIDKPKEQWTDIDVTGFKMENWTLDDFGGGVSVILLKEAFIKRNLSK